MTTPKLEKTERGFQILRFPDHNDNACSLQQSSLAEFEPPGTSAIWLGIDGQTRMHLDMERVVWLIDHLQTWVHTGEFAS